MSFDDYEYRDTWHPPRFNRQRRSEDTFYSVRMQCGTASINVALKSNHRGPFCRITVDDGNGGFASIMISGAQVEDFQQCINEVVKTGAKGMIETSGRKLFARIEADNLVVGEKSLRESVAVIPKEGIPEFQRLYDEAVKALKSSGIQPGKVFLEENTLYSQQILAGRKTIQIMLKENNVGRFIRIVESDGLRYTSVMIPAQHFSDLRYHLNEAICISDKTATVKNDQE